jgi:DNA-binding MarR family transcriptional regulator
VTLTAAGRRLVDGLQPVADESQQGFLNALSVAEQATLVSLLRRALALNDADRSAGRESSGREA